MNARQSEPDPIQSRGFRDRVSVLAVRDSRPSPRPAQMTSVPDTRFEALALPHLDAAFNLARWLVRNDDDAADVVREAFLRAMRSFDGFRGAEARPWLLAKVVARSANAQGTFAASDRGS
jgi:Sigma-70 region 2